MRHVVFVVSLAIALGACDQAGRKEASELDRAVSAYREAENNRKPELALRIAQVPCEKKDICDARTACVTSAKPTGEGLSKKHLVEAFMANDFPKLQPGDPKAIEMLLELDAAEKLLVQGRDTLPACDEAMRQIRKAYSLR